MKIGVVSDSHSNFRLLRQAGDILVKNRRAEVLVHLGDNYRDADELENYGLTVWRVPGLYCPEYFMPGIPRSLRETMDGQRIVMIHDLHQLGRDDIEGSDIVLGGHTHNHEIRVDGGRMFVNPGHLKELEHKGRPASCALLELTEGGIKAKIIGLGGEILLEASSGEQTSSRRTPS
jgi:putative phosphoesterase